MRPLQSGLSLQMNFRSQVLQYLPNQTTNSESMQWIFKKISKTKTGLTENLSVSASWYQEGSLGCGIFTLPN